MYFHQYLFSDLIFGPPSRFVTLTIAMVNSTTATSIIRLFPSRDVTQSPAISAIRLFASTAIKASASTSTLTVLSIASSNVIGYFWTVLICRSPLLSYQKFFKIHDLRLHTTISTTQMNDNSIAYHQLEIKGCKYILDQTDYSLLQPPSKSNGLVPVVLLTPLTSRGAIYFQRFLLYVYLHQRQ